VALEGRNPVCMIVGLLNKGRAGIAPRDSSSFGVRIVEPILDALGIAHYLVELSEHVRCMVPAIEHAYAEARLVAFLIGVEPA